MFIVLILKADATALGDDKFDTLKLSLLFDFLNVRLFLLNLSTILSPINN